jgi:protein-tyrosine-phosphatase
VPDPYYGGEQGFEAVYRITERTARRLLEHFVEAYGLSEVNVSR